MITKYFVRANTSSGCVNLADSNLSDITDVYSLSGISKAVKSELLKLIARHFDLNGEDVDWLVSPFDITQLDGVIIKSRGFAILDEVCFGKEHSKRIISTENIFKNEIEDLEYLNILEKKAKQGYSDLYTAYAEAKKIHDEWEKIYIENINFEMLNSYTKCILDTLIKEKSHKSTTKRCTRFFGASTMDGSVNYVENLTEGIGKRYFIKGRPGTGKSTFLKKLANTAGKAGYDTEVYFCSFDKQSLDMVAVRDAGFCVFDSTAPHELFPSRKNDIILDFYSAAGLGGIDEKYEKELAHISKKYQFRISEGLCGLRLARCFEAEREYLLGQSADYSEIGRLADKIIRSFSE